MSEYDWRHDIGPRLPDPRMALGDAPDPRQAEGLPMARPVPTPTTVPVPAAPDPHDELDLETEHIVRP